MSSSYNALFNGRCQGKSGRVPYKRYISTLSGLLLYVHASTYPGVHNLWELQGSLSTAKVLWPFRFYDG